VGKVVKRRTHVLLRPTDFSGGELFLRLTLLGKNGLRWLTKSRWRSAKGGLCGSAALRLGV